MEKPTIVAVVMVGLLINIIGNVTTSTLLAGERVFALHPRHVWHGTVRSKQIADGDLTLCADSGMWNLAQANQVCHDLGFQKGAMLFGSHPNTIEESRSIRCVFLDEEGIFCSQYNSRCSSSAWVSCQFPAFVGCFPFDQNWVSLFGYQMISDDNDNDDMTIEICIGRCRASLFEYNYAGLEDGSHCYCGNMEPFLPQAEKSLCLQPCVGDDRQACGGFGHIAVYESKLGACNGTYDMSSVGIHTMYLASPGFPGNYNSPTQCQWMFNMPHFNDTVMSILGIDFSQAETLRVMTSEVYTSHSTSDEIWTTNIDPFVKRGNWSLDLMENTISAAVALIFSANQNSRGDKQFLITFTVNTADFYVLPTSTLATRLDTLRPTGGGGHPNSKKHKDKQINGWVFASIIAAIIMICAAIAVGLMYRRNREAVHRDQIFHQSQLRNEANIYGDVVELEPDIDKENNEEHHAHGIHEVINDANDINTTNASNGTGSRVVIST